ncbi:BrnA antitoxin family protein [Paraburkholderia denitrificans]|uniref:BrnA antitoxin family protein n=1 Tax=Paraburkholderia denitrificans TaxID=694025 RepID=A0ABW0JE11_9BURK
MNVSKRNSTWVDPDDAPELTDEIFEHGEWKIGDKAVPPKEGKAALRAAVGRPVGSHKTATTIRFDDDVIEAFRATGKGWQTRMNAALKDWLRTHSPA